MGACHFASPNEIKSDGDSVENAVKNDKHASEYEMANSLEINEQLKGHHHQKRTMAMVNDDVYDHDEDRG
jgi:hypothetical protein